MVAGKRAEPGPELGALFRSCGGPEVEQAVKALDESQVAMETKDAVIKAQEDELERFKAKTFEEPPKFDHVYVFKDLAETCSDVHKIGKAIDPDARKKQLSTGSARGIEEVYKRRTHNAGVVERIVHVAQKRYHVGSIGGREHYNNAMQHSIDNIDIACVFVETLAGSFELMSKEAKVAKIVDRLQCMLTDEPLSAPAKVKEYFDEQDRVARFLKEACVVSPDGRAASADVIDAYLNWAARNDAPELDPWKLAKSLQTKGFAKKTMRMEARSQPVKGYMGFSLAAEEAAEEAPLVDELGG